jgi:hypothetical protein
VNPTAVAVAQDRFQNDPEADRHPGDGPEAGAFEGRQRVQLAEPAGAGGKRLAGAEGIRLISHD